MFEKKSFAITGVGGYIANRHLAAIKATGNKLIAALDPHDSVGRLDEFGYDVKYFQDFETFDRFIEKTKLDFVSICSPNYLHESHCRAAMRAGADAICEKPLVVNPDNLDLLRKAETQTGKRVWAIMQMRYHPEIIRLKNLMDRPGERMKEHAVQMCYVTSRGNWYHYSWKGDPAKSGGLIMNIGVHLFDLLLWIFGGCSSFEIEQRDRKNARGILNLKNANVHWYLSIDPDQDQCLNNPVQRSLNVDGEVFDFSQYGGELHNTSYREILAGRGFGIEDTRPSLELCSRLSTTRIKDEQSES